MKTFFKYQSLGNDFILIEDTALSPEAVKALCNRHTGIGADGVLVVHPLTKCVSICNSDGSHGQISLNGSRCAALHLYKHHNFPKEFSFTMGEKTIFTNMQDFPLITQYIAHGTYFKEITLDSHIGHIVDVGNPHFIIFEEQTLPWLAQHGAAIEQHPMFPHKTNVEFIWKTGPNTYNAIVYERGCGITQACSSGAAAITTALYARNKLKLGETLTINMPGGQVITQVLQDKIMLQALAHEVFRGTIS